MKTLVIHPADDSTDFLKEIYRDKDWTVINDFHMSRKKVIEEIKLHDRIIMMGHGSPHGLFYTPINCDMVYLLREKQCVCIWCNADQFVLRYGLKGFYTGMFISEVGEARYFGITISQEMVDRSNRDFSFEMRLCLDHDDPKLICEEIKSTYVGPTSVYKFNNDRLYYRDDTTPVLPDDSSKELLIY
jgi:hypothetical protein